MSRTSCTVVVDEINLLFTSEINDVFPGGRHIAPFLTDAFAKIYDPGASGTLLKQRYLTSQ